MGIEPGGIISLGGWSHSLQGSFIQYRPILDKGNVWIKQAPVNFFSYLSFFSYQKEQRMKREIPATIVD